MIKLRVSHTVQINSPDSLHRGVVPHAETKVNVAEFRDSCKSIFETAFAYSGIRLEVPLHYEPFRLVLRDGHDLTPDFVLPRRRNRYIAFEPHSLELHSEMGREHMIADLRRFEAFHKEYCGPGGKFFLVLASDMHPSEIERMSGMRISSIANRYWQISQGGDYGNIFGKVLGYMAHLLSELRVPTAWAKAEPEGSGVVCRESLAPKRNELVRFLSRYATRVFHHAT